MKQIYAEPFRFQDRLYFVGRKFTDFDLSMLIRQQPAQAIIVLPIEFSADNDHMKIHSAAKASRLIQKSFDGVEKIRIAAGSCTNRIKLVDNQYGFATFCRNREHESGRFLEAKLLS